MKLNLVTAGGHISIYNKVNRNWELKKLPVVRSKKRFTTDAKNPSATELLN